MTDEPRSDAVAVPQAPGPRPQAQSGVVPPPESSGDAGADCRAEALDWRDPRFPGEEGPARVYCGAMPGGDEVHLVFTRAVRSVIFSREEATKLMRQMMRARSAAKPRGKAGKKQLKGMRHEA